MGKITTKTLDKSVFVLVPKTNRQQAEKMFHAAPFYDAKGKIDFFGNTLPIIDFETTRLITRSDVMYLQQMLDVIYPKSRYTPTKLKLANDDLIEHSTMVKYTDRAHPKLKAAGVLACVMKEWRNMFNIFINEDMENESYDSADLHEKGHILFNHTAGTKMYIEQFRKEIDKIWDLKLAKYFESTTFKNSKDKIVRMLFNEFSNIAQDMEINSKLFDNGEWVKAKKTLARSATVVHYLDVYREFDELSGLIKNENARNLGHKSYEKIVKKFLIVLSNIIDRIDGKEGDFKFCYPTNKGWPEKLDWMTYMILLVKDIDDTMEQVLKQIQEKLQAGAAAQGSGNGGAGTGTAGGQKKISQDILDEYFDQDKSEKDAMDDANEGGGIGDDEDDEETGDASSGGRSQGGEGRGRGSSPVEVEFETCETFDSFTKFLRKNCLGKKNRRWNSDVLYNSNRGKFASRVVVPRRHLIEKWMPTECHIIVDVSGSVPTDYVERVINSIVDTNSGIDLARSHIIFCDTSVVSDEIMNARTKSVYSGGGTEIAEGIKYVAKKGYCSKRTDKLFIISDFQDNLNAWVQAAQEIPGIKYAIGYNVTNKEDCNRIFDHAGYGGRGDGEFKQKWNNTFKTVFITEVI